MNVVTQTVYGTRPPGDRWHRAQWVTTGEGLRAIRYETDFDLTILMRNIATAGGLAMAWKIGQANGAQWFAGREVRKDRP